MKTIFSLLLSITFLSTTVIYSQDKIDLSKYSFQIENFNDGTFLSFTKQRLENSQFVFVGEQHGIKEVGIFTNSIYDIAQPFGYHTLCIETDAIAAEKITAIASSHDPIGNAKKLHQEFPFAIPFYNNEDDYDLFTNVIKKKGMLWGIDQTFMVQFRLNFDYIISTTDNTPLKEKLQELKKEANESYQYAIANKKYGATYIFKYNEALHKSLLELATDAKEIEILKQLWKTKEIYAYNMITKEYYKNNNTRSQLMKRNFLNYYDNTKDRNTTPKVIFKLGANHAAKGLNRTNIYDISNMASELAIINKMHSLHYMVMGITGKAAIGNPFSPIPVVPFDNIKDFPEEIQKVIPTITKKYYILDLASLRPLAYANFSDAFKKTIFRYDVLVLVQNAEAFKGF
ncbi:hypothetical protein IWQ47_000683 [Aquimarina sp. EL_43]|uniref:hypothetical protein n=1 Tax=unclassified Aquimarina TaxID=2627091 RepID=UPI0018CB67CC|nr:MULTISPECIES: hypothetical protein [unclassified Aquimarina]MBG6128627.1 hypothetical protein [Aquimarina sp. EL_35]MBG6149690.1 hypothetical protein [Aquimarina sp. EL_32]MBG6167625.1 hypothetical protein [Aquimarina sp. EL_43]